MTDGRRNVAPYGIANGAPFPKSLPLWGNVINLSESYKILDAALGLRQRLR